MPILIVEHAGLRRTVPMNGRVSIGRDAACDIVINHPIVSRRHAFVEPNGSDATAIVTDNQSRNGIMIAGQKLDAPRPLRDGDIFQVGPATIAFHTADPEIDIEAPSVDEGEVAGIVFACDCGARLWAPRGASGASTICPQCRQKVRCPGGDSDQILATGTRAQICSVCHWKIEKNEQRTACPACGLNYHTDCWRDNKGCAAYGCSQVGALAPKDDSEAADETSMAADAAATDRPRGEPMIEELTDLEDAAAPPTAIEVPLVACAVLSSLVGLIAYGIPALVVAAVAVIYLILRRGRDRKLLLIATAIGLLGAVVGVLSSLYWWMNITPLQLIGQ